MNSSNSIFLYFYEVSIPPSVMNSGLVDRSFYTVRKAFVKAIEDADLFLLVENVTILFGCLILFEEERDVEFIVPRSTFIAQKSVFCWVIETLTIASLIKLYNSQIILDVLLLINCKVSSLN